MLNFSFHLPTEIVHGQEAVTRNATRFSEFGEKALIITGKRSAKASGALDDVIASLTQQKINYQIFDHINSNPSVINVEAGAKLGREYQPDFVIGIGGGSPLDAAKAIALLLTNNITALELYTNKDLKPALPLIAIPTTAGTGSEVTQYAVLTIPAKQTKKGFGDQSIFPKLAFLDYRYTESLELEQTRDTAVDALSHLIEAYLSRRATNASDMLAEAGLKLWSQSIVDLKAAAFSSGLRDTLLVASTIGGMAIAHTGTTIVHALGYPLTYYHEIPHGRANGLIMAEYLKYTREHAKSRVDKILQLLNLKNMSQFRQLMKQLLPCDLTLTADQINEYAIAASRTKNATHTIGEIGSQICIDILESSLGN